MAIQEDAFDTKPNTIRVDELYSKQLNNNSNKRAENNPTDNNVYAHVISAYT